MHKLEGDVLSAEPVHKKRTTTKGYEIEFPQAAGGIHIHPNGRTVYVSNRANATVDFNGKRVFRGGENNIAVFSIDQSTGEPTLIQNADSQSFHVRTFSIDPSGKIMVAASIAGIGLREGDDVRNVPAALTVFRILDDGKLQFVRKLDVDVGGKFQWWTGFVDLV
jgi:DNA-binding beta-propeller fold protein YncE